VYWENVFEDLQMSIHLGKKIQAVAVSKGYTQKKLAGAVNTTQQNISDIYGRPDLDTALLKAFSKELNHDFAQYLYEDDSLSIFKQKEIGEWQSKIENLQLLLTAKEELLKEREKVVEMQVNLINELKLKTSK